jgi:hypothetical protein
MKKTARADANPQVDVCDALTASMTNIMAEYSNNEVAKAGKITEQEGVEQFLVSIGCSRDEFAANSRTAPVVAAPAAATAKRGRKNSKTPTTTAAASNDGGTQADYILNWFAKQPNQTASIKELKAHFSQEGRSANTAAVMVATLTKSGLLKSTERGVYSRTKKAA